MNILLISGHTSGYNKTKNGLRNEGDLNIELVSLIESKLKGYATIYKYPTNRNAYDDLKAGKIATYLPNGYKYDYCLEVHFNATNGNAGSDGKLKGTEIFITSLEKGHGVETKIMQNLKPYFPLRGNNGGVKVYDYGVIYRLKQKGVSSALIETCFYDDEDDMKVYNANKDKIAQGIVDGIVSGFGLKTTSTTITPPVDSTPTPTPTPTPTVTTTQYYNKYTGTSGAIDTVLKSIGVPSTYYGSYLKRKKIANKNGISNYIGSASQNTKLVSLAKQGKLLKV